MALLTAAAHSERHSHPPHEHHHHHHGSGAPIRALSWAVALTVAVMIVEAAVSAMTGSLALLADAAHMLADSSALVLALVAQRFALRRRTSKSTFGHRRAEVLAAFVNGIVLSVTALWIVKEAVERWMLPRQVDAVPMLATACLGLVANLVVAGVLAKATRGNLNVRAAFLHVLTDALGSLGAILAGLSILLFDAQRADPALSVAISVLVAYSGWRVLRETTAILLESAPPHLDVAAIEGAIRRCPGVADVHDLHVWRISDAFDALTVHVTLARGAHGVEVCRAVGDRLAEDFGLSHVTVQPEAPPPDELVPLRLGPRAGPSKTP